MKPVRGIITNRLLPDGVPRRGVVQPLTVELILGTDNQEGPFGRPEHPTALGLPCLRDVVDGTIYLVEDLPPFSEFRVTEPPADEEGRKLLEALIAEGLPIADSPLTGEA